jgi:uncharacterized protein
MHLTEAEFVQLGMVQSEADRAQGVYFPGYLQTIAKEALDIVRQQQEPTPTPHITQFIVKTVTDCNLRCIYPCYEYVNDRWRSLPPIMTGETMATVGAAIGEHAARHNLPEVSVVLHGGEPLYMHKPEAYYTRTLPLLLGSIVMRSPATRVDLGMQTNGIFLRAPILDAFSDFADFAIGVSLDGNQQAHDRNRLVQRSGKGSHALVERGIDTLRSPKYRHMFGGLLAVVDLHNDPVEVYEELKRFDPPTVDVLLPYGTWDEPPPGIELSNPGILAAEGLREWLQFAYHERRRLGHSLIRHPVDTNGHELYPYRKETPYADWMLAMFDRYNADIKRATAGLAPKPPVIRYIESIKRLKIGRQSLTEALGLQNGSEIVIRTDGSVELPDSLNVINDSAVETGFNLVSGGAKGKPDTVEDVERFMLANQHLGPKELAVVCKLCPLGNICGGGHISNRHSRWMGFDNPSVYCEDLIKLIAVIGATIESDAMKTAALALNANRTRAS